MEKIKIVLKQKPKIITQDQQRPLTPSDLNCPVFVMCPPLHAKFLPNNIWMEEIPDKTINVPAFIYQWRQLYSILANFGIVYTFPSVPGLQDEHYINSFVYLPHIKDRPTCIISRFKAAGRQLEEDVAERFLADMGYRTAKVPAGMTFEGEPCLKWLRDHYYLGSFGVRTTREALEWIENNYDCRIFKIGLEDEHCYDAETEILTDKGWKYFKDLDGSEKVATVNPETGEIEYQKPYEYIVINYSGKVYHFKGKRMDLRVTAKHKLFMSRGSKPEDFKTYFFVEAEDFVSKEGRYICMKSAGIQKGIIPEKIEIGETEYDFKEFVKLMAWYISEGCICHGDHSKHIKIPQKEHKDEIREILENLKIKYTEVKDGFIICNKELADFFEITCGSHSYEKRIPDFIKQCDYTILRDFIKELVKGDGSFRSKTYDKRYDKEYNCYIMSYFTCSEQLADEIQELAVKSGWRAKKRTAFRIKPRKIKGNFQEFVVDINYDKDYITEYVKNNVEIEEVENETFYDVNVPKYHLLIVRRKGCVVLSSNCYHGDCIFFPITHQDVILVESNVNKEELKFLESHANIYMVDRDLGLNGITNSIVVDNLILTANNYDFYIRTGQKDVAEIEKRKLDTLEHIAIDLGFEVVHIEIPEALKQGALLSCMVARLNWIDRIKIMAFDMRKKAIDDLIPETTTELELTDALNS